MTVPPERRGADGQPPGRPPERRWSSKVLGEQGEARAAAWYEAHGYEVVARNWRCPEGELDLVARRDDVLVFCEVKTRSSTRYGVPAEAVTADKQRRLRRLAGRYLAGGSGRAPTAELRFDVACVLGGRVEVIEGAF